MIDVKATPAQIIKKRNCRENWLPEQDSMPTTDGELSEGISMFITMTHPNMQRQIAYLTG